MELLAEVLKVGIHTREYELFRILQRLRHHPWQTIFPELDALLSSENPPDINFLCEYDYPDERIFFYDKSKYITYPLKFLFYSVLWLNAEINNVNVIVKAYQYMLDHGAWIHYPMFTLSTGETVCANAIDDVKRMADHYVAHEGYTRAKNLRQVVTFLESYEREHTQLFKRSAHVVVACDDDDDDDDDDAGETEVSP